MSKDLSKIAGSYFGTHNTTVALNHPATTIFKNGESFSRGAPTAIGGTLNRFGHNVSWQLYVDSVTLLPTESTVGHKALVTDTNSVYKFTDTGWVLDEPDTKFLNGET